MLEFGVSEDTQVSLISMGLSRTTVVSLLELMPSSDWAVDDCLRWLREQDIELLDGPTLVQGPCGPGLACLSRAFWQEHSLSPSVIGLARRDVVYEAPRSVLAWSLSSRY
jgi:hypothetical protein